ncbi:MAG TPA: filamentous hemagglutinin N-terminal domain-containing protein [Tepidisphaeraceae bacterium]|jgi:filamentous hemagglutinin family protein|nr:filamentous hemagglutinin N-terminal domain-containing protein [Tepidisphaeraceae bacterium]
MTTTIHSLAADRSDISKETLHRRRNARSRSVLCLAAAASVAALSGAALAGHANVKIDKVVSGTATVSQTASQTRIAATNGAIINFASFDIPKGTSVNIVLPSASGRVLDRVTSGSPSQIDGSLFSNGTIYFVNPAGVFFGPSANVSAGGVCAVAGNLANADFTAGTNHFTGVAGTISNQGAIHASGDVSLVGKTVVNTGSIVSDGGAVALVSGQDVLLSEKNSRVFAKIAPAAPAGQALGSGDIYAMALRNGGHIKARQVTLQSDSGSAVSVGGAVDVSNHAAGARGGNVDITGGAVTLTGATVNASGTLGGGSVNIGGDSHGAGSLPNANLTSISKDSSIHADALANGNGGAVTVWSQQKTIYDGLISARGAGQGNGGNAEISSHDQLSYLGAVDLSSTSGHSGMLLLDPADITIGGASSGSIPVSEILDATTPMTLQASSSITVASRLIASRAIDLTLDAPVLNFNSVVGGKISLTLKNSTTSTMTVNGNIGSAGHPVDSVRFATQDKIEFSGSDSQSISTKQLIQFEALPSLTSTIPEPTTLAPLGYVGDVEKTSGNLTFTCTTFAPGQEAYLPSQPNFSGIDLGFNRIFVLDAGSLVLKSSHIFASTVSATTFTAEGANSPISHQVTFLTPYPSATLASAFPEAETTAAPRGSDVISRSISEFQTVNAIAPIEFYTSNGGTYLPFGTHYVDQVGGSGNVNPQKVIQFVISTDFLAIPFSTRFAAAVTPSNPATAIAGNVSPIQAAVFPPPEPLAATAIEELKLLGIFVNGAERPTVGNEYRIIDDWPHLLAPNPQDRLVSPSRVTKATAIAAAQQYVAVFGKNGEKDDAQQAIARLLANMKSQRVSPADFAKYVNSLPAADRSRRIMIELKDLREKVENLGLSQAETQSSFDYWMSPLVVTHHYDVQWLKDVLSQIK